MSYTDTTLSDLPSVLSIKILKIATDSIDVFIHRNVNVKALIEKLKIQFSLRVVHSVAKYYFLRINIRKVSVAISVSKKISRK